MSTVADDLLNDFGSSGDEAEEELNDGLIKDEEATSNRDAMQLDGDAETRDDEDSDEGMNDREDSEATKVKVEKMQLGGVKDVRSVANLMQTLEPVLEVSTAPFKPSRINGRILMDDSFTSVLLTDSPDVLPRTLQRIAHYRSQAATQNTNVGNIEDHPEYHLLTQSNSLSTQIDGEVVLVHKFIRDHYSTRFPELERLVTTPIEYAKVVAIIGNGPLDSESIKALQTSTDNPRPSRLSPTLVGSLTAAQLLNAAGGLTGLSKTPACNIASWGSKKKHSGLATNIGVRQQGYLYNSEMIRGIPTDLKKQALRIVSAKLVLAARVDRTHSSPDGSTGEELKSACLERLEKLTEPPPNKGQRALPVPDDKPSRKRGGRRARKAKEALAMTDLRKQQNRMAFGKEEREVGYGTGESTVGMGMIGQSNDGRIRSTQIDQRTRAKLSAKSKGWGGNSTVGGAASSIGGFGQASNIDLRGRGLRASGVGSTIGSATGTASSLSFTPVQGLELVDPKMQAELSKKRKAEEDRWFKGGSFTQVGGSSSGSVFKVPALPAAKRVDTGSTKTGASASK
ncbi:hypothetical protein CEK25_000555 [Fusarium fujikuroi]|nr:hypothetical protein CEK25_000555 [Fusarium fujikuroi]